MKKRSLLTIYLGLVVFLYPLFLFPLFREAFVLGKNFFLIGAVLIGVIFWLITLWREKEVRLYLSRSDSALLLFSLVLAAYLFFLSRGNRYEALISQVGAGTFWALFGLAFLLAQSDWRNKPQKLFVLLGVSGAIAALVTVILFIIPPSKFPLRLLGQNSPLVIGDPLWSPLGSLLELLWWLIPVLVFVIVHLVRQVNRREKMGEWHLFVLAVILLVGLAAAVLQLVKAKIPFLDYRTSWAVAVESFKQRPLFGAGPARFDEVFTLFKPAEFNGSQWWATRFVRPSSFYLQLWAELGVLGLALFVWFLWRVKKEADKKPPELRWSWLVLLALGLFLPAALAFPFLALVLSVIMQEKKEVVLPYSKVSLQVVSGLAVILLLVSGYFYSKALLGEFLFFRFVRGIATGQGRDSDYYKAVRFAPLVADFRIFRSQVDLSVMRNIIQNNQGKQLDQTQQQQLTLLAQEGINEAKAAVALRPRNVIGWENLAQTYRQLIGLAQGADQWTISAYLQAVALDSLNPRLRVDLGGVYYALGNYEEAARQFETAIRLKRDYSNGWYNLAWALKQQKKLKDAIGAMQQVLLLVKADTPDYQRAQTELEEWKKELGEEEKPTVPEKTEELTPPQPIPSPQVSPIQLPKEAAPEIEITPSPEPSPTPTVAE